MKKKNSKTANKPAEKYGYILQKRYVPKSIKITAKPTKKKAPL